MKKQFSKTEISDYYISVGILVWTAVMMLAIFLSLFYLTLEYEVSTKNYCNLSEQDEYRGGNSRLVMVVCHNDCDKHCND